MIKGGRGEGRRECIDVSVRCVRCWYGCVVVFELQSVRRARLNCLSAEQVSSRHSLAQRKLHCTQQQQTTIIHMTQSHQHIDKCVVYVDLRSI